MCKRDRGVRSDMRCDDYSGALGVLLVFDITSRESFQRLDFWLSKVRAVASPSVFITLLGNKVRRRGEAALCCL